MIYVGPRLADDLKEFCHKAEAVHSGIEKSVNINGDLILVSFT